MKKRARGGGSPKVNHARLGLECGDLLLSNPFGSTCQDSSWTEAHDGMRSAAPAFRHDAAVSIESSGRLWLFAGMSDLLGFFTDLWYFEAGHVVKAVEGGKCAGDAYKS